MDVVIRVGREKQWVVLESSSVHPPFPHFLRSITMLKN